MIKKLKLQANLDNYKKFMDFIQTQMSSSCVKSSIITDIMIACEEVVANIINYAYPGKEGELEVSFEEKEGLACIIFKDNGKLFNPIQKQAPDVNKSIEYREIGGLGIHLVKKLMDEVNYEYKENTNMLTIIKRIS